MEHKVSTTILVCGASGMLVAAFILAWIATLTRLIQIAAMRHIVKDYSAIIRAHIDYLLMALFCLAFSEMQIALPNAACVLVVTGGFMNPSLFVIRGLFPRAANSRATRFYRTTSFTISTFGFMWVAASMVRSVLA